MRTAWLILAVFVTAGLLVLLLAAALAANLKWAGVA
jgi:hypothetical protein